MSRSRLPRVVGTLLRWTLPADRREESLGDLLEIHAARSARLGRRVAGRLLWREWLGLLAWRARVTRTGDFDTGARDARTAIGGGMMLGQDFTQDVRFALRTLRRRPSFTLIAVAVMGLGIGAPTTVFSLVNGIFFSQPDGLEEPHRLTRVFRMPRPDARGGSFQNADYHYYRDAASTVDLAAFSGSPGAATYSLDGTGTDQLGLEYVSGNFFDVLGTRMHLGRGFRPDENATPGTHPVVVLSHAFWRRALGEDTNAVGRSIAINGTTFEVVGVTDESFEGINVTRRPSDVWVPIAMHAVVTGRAADADMAWWQREPQSISNWLNVIGRLEPGVTHEAAQANLSALSDALEWDGRNEGETIVAKRQFLYSPGQQTVLERLSFFLLAVVGIVLLVASANVAVLLLSRASTRSREMGIRAAVGAGRGRLSRQLLTESVVLGMLGALVGLGIAWAAADFAAGLMPIALEMSFAPDWTVAIATILLGVVTSCVVGLAPVVQVSSSDVRSSISDGAQRTGRSRGKASLVVGQLALSMVLVAGALLFARSFWEARSQDLGFDYDDRLIVRVNLQPLGYGEEDGLGFWSRALEAVEALPGVEAATVSRMVPFQGMWTSDIEAPPGATPNAGETQIYTGMNVVWPGYFEALGIDMVAGRAFDATDVTGSGSKAIINEHLAREVWPDEPLSGVLGKTLPIRGDAEIIGVAATSTYYALGEEPEAQTWGAMSQFYIPSAAFMVRTSVPATDLSEAVQRTLREIEPRLAFNSVTTLGAVVADQTAEYEVTAVLVGIFGMMALLLAAVGLYGVISFLVAQRTREIGVRMALGADRRRVAREVLGSGVRLAVVGLVIGLLGALGVRRFTESFLFGVEPGDPLPLIGAAVVLFAVAVVATMAPAGRATRVDPMEAIRSD